MKKLLKITCAFLMCFSLIGCKQTIDSTKKIDYKEVEISNVEADKELIDKAENIYDKNYKKTENNTEKQVVVVKYLDDIYQIASNRVSLDLDILDAFSDEYENYIATMQAYSEVYLKEKEELVANSKLLDKADVSTTNSGKMLAIVEDTIEDFLK